MLHNRFLKMKDLKALPKTKQKNVFFLSEVIVTSELKRKTNHWLLTLVQVIHFRHI